MKLAGQRGQGDGVIVLLEKADGFGKEAEESLVGRRK